MAGFRATVVVRDPANCPVADVSDRTEEPVDSVSRSSQAVDGAVVEELGVARSTFTQHLAAAQTKLLDAILEEEP